jgi:predicted RNase H-like HicB family nuclease
MEEQKLAFTAVYMRSNGEYIGFIEELPTMNARGRTLSETREALQNLAAEVFDEERPNTARTHAGRAIVRADLFGLLTARAEVLD